MRADFKCKLYRFDPESSEWKERGVGMVKLLEHKDNHKIRLLMRQEKTLKIRANHIGARARRAAMYPDCHVVGHVGECMTCAAPDYCVSSCLLQVLGNAVPVLPRNGSLPPSDGAHGPSGCSHARESQWLGPHARRRCLPARSHARHQAAGAQRQREVGCVVRRRLCR